MKKIWVYLLGILTGIVVTIIALIIIGAVMRAKNDSETRMDNGLSFFEEPGEVVEPSSVKVFQALGDGVALAECKGDSYYTYSGPDVLLYNEDGFPYYDDQVINAPQGGCFRQVGIYRYSSRRGDRTVPIVMIMDK